MNPSFTLGEEFPFHDSSTFRKKAGDAKLRFYDNFVPVLMSLAAESCRSRAESVHLLKPYLQWRKSFFPSCASVALARSSHIIVLIERITQMHTLYPSLGVRK